MNVLLPWIALNKLTYVPTGSFHCYHTLAQDRSKFSLKIHKGYEILGSAFLILNITKLMQFWKELVFSSMYLRW